jgi:small GTP-binding protein domain
MKSGFVSIFGRPNAGKSTLLNALLQEKLAIVSPKVQTTRHRIKGIVTTDEYQIIFSDTPGIIEPQYKLQEKMMNAVKQALEDADVAVLLIDINENWEDVNQLFESLRLQVPAIVAINKVDEADENKNRKLSVSSMQKYCTEIVAISALQGYNISELVRLVVKYLPEGMPFSTVKK